MKQLTNKATRHIAAQIKGYSSKRIVAVALVLLQDAIRDNPKEIVEQYGTELEVCINTINNLKNETL